MGALVRGSKVLLMLEEASRVRRVVTGVDGTHVLLVGRRRHSLHGVGVIGASARVVTIHHSSVATLSKCLLEAVASLASAAL